MWTSKFFYDFFFANLRNVKADTTKRNNIFFIILQITNTKQKISTFNSKLSEISRNTINTFGRKPAMEIAGKDVD
jgi:adenosine deaminase